jgi:hypothetical protein
LVQQIEKLAFNTTKVSPREILSQGYYDSYTDFFLKHNKHVVRVNQDVVKVETTYLHDHTIIASFIGKKPSPNAFNVWLAFLN